MILLSFDIEEFDMPFEYNKTISFDDQMSISISGTTIILDLLEKHNIKATFFSTATFAIHAQKIIKRIVDEGHELASHTYYHSAFKNEDLPAFGRPKIAILGIPALGSSMPLPSKCLMTSSSKSPVPEPVIEEIGYT